MRLQGFSDDWCDDISDSQKYKCAGNAVTVNVIQDIMEKLLVKKVIQFKPCHTKTKALHKK